MKKYKIEIQVEEYITFIIVNAKEVVQVDEATILVDGVKMEFDYVQGIPPINSINVL